MSSGRAASRVHTCRWCGAPFRRDTCGRAPHYCADHLPLIVALYLITPLTTGQFTRRFRIGGSTLTALGREWFGTSRATCSPAQRDAIRHWIDEHGGMQAYAEANA